MRQAILCVAYAGVLCAIVAICGASADKAEGKTCIDDIIKEKKPKNSETLLDVLDEARSDVDDSCVQLANALSELDRVHKGKCQLDDAYNLQSLVEMYNDSSKPQVRQLVDYVNGKAHEQFDICVPAWEDHVQSSMKSMGYDYQGDMKDMLDTMVAMLRDPSGHKVGQVAGDHSADELAQILTQNPALGLAAYMKSKTPVTERTSKTDYSSKYRYVVKKQCESINNALMSDVRLFEIAFAYDSALEKKISPNNLQWLACMKICKMVSEDKSLEDQSYEYAKTLKLK